MESVGYAVKSSPNELRIVDCRVIVRSGANYPRFGSAGGLSDESSVLAFGVVDCRLWVYHPSLFRVSQPSTITVQPILGLCQLAFIEGVAVGLVQRLPPPLPLKGQ